MTVRRISDIHRYQRREDVGTARDFGISADRAVNYHADHKGTDVLYRCVGNAVSAARKVAPKNADWSAELQEDYQSR